MKAARGEGPSRVMCGHRYRDAPAAIDWLCGVFGFERHAVHCDEDGNVLHAQLVLGGGMIFVASALDTPFASLIKQPEEIDRWETRNVYLLVEDADAVHATAVAEGAEIVIPIADVPYGGRVFTCRDLEGHLWSIGTYDPWSDPG
ncbi:MAG: VOC family protein [Candidatus Palauibacterales bacterium]|nr:VOC family protein [Candidatus Palauibacterales bacterium]